MTRPMSYSGVQTDATTARERGHPARRERESAKAVWHDIQAWAAALDGQACRRTLRRAGCPRSRLEVALERESL